jgi:hypothetical protein
VNRLVRGLVAGAVGSVALEATAWLDMTVRGRPESVVPKRVTDEMLNDVGIDLQKTGSTGELHDQADKEHTDQRHNRLKSMGILTGYGTGLGFGAAYGLLAPWLRTKPRWLVGPALGLAIMSFTEGGAVVAGATDEKNWGAEGWLEALVPHLVFGIATVATYDAIGD